MYTDNRDQATPASAFNLEQRRLASTNRPGLGEEDVDSRGVRARRPSISAARAAYQEAVQTFKLLLEELFEPDPSQSGLPVEKKQVQEAYSSAKAKWEFVREKADIFRDSLSSEGAGTEVGGSRQRGDSPTIPADVFQAGKSGRSALRDSFLTRLT